MRILNEYAGSHHYWTVYEKQDCYCMNCGKKDCVWEETCGDYYVGGYWVCVECNYKWHCPDGIFPAEDKNLLLQIQQLRDGQAKEPTTPRGT